jgi:hypothetical protein
MEIEIEMAELREELAILKQTCPLGPYKNEMKERCERFNDAILTTKETLSKLESDIEKKIIASEARCESKSKYNRMIMGRMISSAIVLSVCLISIIGALQLTKISRSEFDAHVQTYSNERKERAIKFDNFIRTYTYDRDKRDEKIDSLFDKQSEFNARIMKQNALLEQHLEVVKAKIEANGRK